MAIEIERRFLVKGEEWRNHAGPPQPLRQGYLTSSLQGWTVRVRILNQQASWLTLKSRKSDIAKYEFEYLIPLEDAESLWLLAPHKVLKTRYELILNSTQWIVDCFEGENAPLRLAEVELQSASQEIIIPAWCVKEITGENIWSNAALAKAPITSWPIELRQRNLLN